MTPSTGTPTRQFQSFVSPSAAPLSPLVLQQQQPGPVPLMSLSPKPSFLSVNPGNSALSYPPAAKLSSSVRSFFGSGRDPTRGVEPITSATLFPPVGAGMQAQGRRQAPSTYGFLSPRGIALSSNDRAASQSRARAFFAASRVPEEEPDERSTCLSFLRALDNMRCFGPEGIIAIARKRDAYPPCSLVSDLLSPLIPLALNGRDALEPNISLVRSPPRSWVEVRWSALNMLFFFSLSFAIAVALARYPDEKCEPVGGPPPPHSHRPTSRSQPVSSLPPPLPYPRRPGPRCLLPRPGLHRPLSSPLLGSPLARDPPARPLSQVPLLVATVLHPVPLHNPLPRLARHRLRRPLREARLCEMAGSPVTVSRSPAAATLDCRGNDVLFLLSRPLRRPWQVRLRTSTSSGFTFCTYPIPSLLWSPSRRCTLSCLTVLSNTRSREPPSPRFQPSRTIPRPPWPLGGTNFARTAFTDF